MFARLVRETGLDVGFSDAATVGEVFDEAFATLRRAGLRNEYVYRAALVNNVLMGTHSLRTASMLTEFRAVSSKADLVILNGTATVYEIKSERDSLGRLAKQITDYQRVFAKVFVIAGADHIEEVAKQVPEHVGILCLKRWNRISTIRDAQSCLELIDSSCVLDSLRSSEAKLVLERVGLSVPNVPNTKMRAALLEEFEQLDTDVLHRTMVAVLKSSRNLSSLHYFVQKMPLSLQAAALTYKIQKSQHDNLIKAVSTPFASARHWV
ncbi:sce7726 family protein [Ruegeria faecimaris]|uniref:sce7726 family protein n=1 Tax=Ruegeria faecimaris TaxID=686389 RepID=UPI00232DE149|nr:sce7726 family protein [Ruegeria faecimaris]